MKRLVFYCDRATFEEFERYVLPPGRRFVPGDDFRAILVPLADEPMDAWPVLKIAQSPEEVHIVPNHSHEG